MFILKYQADIIKRCFVYLARNELTELFLILNCSFVVPLARSLSLSLSARGALCDAGDEQQLFVPPDPPHSLYSILASRVHQQRQ